MRFVNHRHIQLGKMYWPEAAGTGAIDILDKWFEHGNEQTRDKLYPLMTTVWERNWSGWTLDRTADVAGKRMMQRQLYYTQFYKPEPGKPKNIMVPDYEALGVYIEKWGVSLWKYYVGKLFREVQLCEYAYKADAVRADWNVLKYVFAARENRPKDAYTIAGEKNWPVHRESEEIVPYNDYVFKPDNSSGAEKYCKLTTLGEKFLARVIIGKSWLAHRAVISYVRQEMFKAGFYTIDRKPDYEKVGMIMSGFVIDGYDREKFFEFLERVHDKAIELREEFGREEVNVWLGMHFKGMFTLKAKVASLAIMASSPEDGQKQKEEMKSVNESPSMEQTYVAEAVRQVFTKPAASYVERLRRNASSQERGL